MGSKDLADSGRSSPVRTGRASRFDGAMTVSLVLESETWRMWLSDVGERADLNVSGRDTVR